MPLPEVDILADLNDGLPELPDNSVKRVFSRHTMEHIRNFLVLMDDLHRILSPEGELEIVVPHFSNPFFYSDPTHVRHFGLYTMHYFSDENEQPGKRKVATFYTTTRFQIRSIRIDFYRHNLFDRILAPIIKTLVNQSFATQAIYERYLCWIYPAWQIKYVLTPKK